MALAIDASTPAYVNSGSAATSGTTASFTPPLGALLVVLQAQGGNATAILQPTNTGGAVRWDLNAASSSLGNSVTANVWCGVVTTSASMTVTVTFSGGASLHVGFGVAVVTGQDQNYLGASGVNSSAGDLPNFTFGRPLQGTNSLVLCAVANGGSTTVGTPGTGQSLSFNSISFSGAATTTSNWAQYLTGMNLNAGSLPTLNDTAPNVNYGMAAAEIVALDGRSVGRGPLQYPFGQFGS